MDITDPLCVGVHAGPWNRRPVPQVRPTPVCYFTVMLDTLFAGMGVLFGVASGSFLQLAHFLKDDFHYRATMF